MYLAYQYYDFVSLILGQVPEEASNPVSIASILEAQGKSVNNNFLALSVLIVSDF